MFVPQKRRYQTEINKNLRLNDGKKCGAVLESSGTAAGPVNKAQKALEDFSYLR